MKKTILFLSLISIFSCNNESGKSKRTTYDTSVQLGLYLDYGLSRPLYGPVRKVSASDSTFKAVLGGDTTRITKDISWYEVDVNIPIDSTTSKIFQVPLLDSSNKKYSIVRTVYSDKSYVLETNFVNDTIKDYQSALKHLNKFIPKQDTSTIKK